MLRTEPLGSPEEQAPTNLRNHLEPLTPSLIRAALRETRPRRFGALHARVNAVMRAQPWHDDEAPEFDRAEFDLPAAARPSPRRDQG